MILTIKKWGINGEGIAYWKKKPVFVEGGMPDEVVDAELTEEHDTYCVAEIKKVIEASPRRRRPMCAITKECGGCPLMHADMKGQLRMKSSVLKEALKKYANYSGEILPIIKNPDVLAYRNACKLRFFNKDNEIYCGLYERDSNKVVKMERCIIHDKDLERVRVQIVQILNAHNAKAFTKNEECGFRSLVMKSFDHKVQVVLVTSGMRIEKNMIEEIMEIDGVVSLWQSIKSQDESELDVFGKRMVHLAGLEKMEVKVCGLDLALLPRSFFQLNTRQAENLYSVVRDWTPKCRTVVEAYCGIGAMALLAASKARKVIGIESIEDAVINAQENAKKNNIGNVRFICGDAGEELIQISEKKKIDTLIVDPPRSGLDEKMKEAIINARVRTIIYVSCNPSTLAKDLGVLKDQYAIKKVQPVDMFSQTPHVETVCLMSRKEK